MAKARGSESDQEDTLQDGALVVENDVEKRTVNPQFIAGAIINEAQFPKPVHEEAYPWASCTHHLCQRLLTDPGDHRFGLSVLAEMSQQ